MERSIKAAERMFWIKVEKVGAKECWKWVGRVGSDGYGIFTCGFKIPEYRAHRFSMWLRLKGVLTRNEWVLHHCDNPLCVNPSHLFLGTPQDNVRDMINKGRHNHGENHGTAKLTEAQVFEIVEIYNRERLNYKDLAIRFGVCSLTISKIIRGVGWKHLGIKRVEGRPDNRKGRKLPSINVGENNGKTKLTSRDVKEIVEMRGRGMLFKTIGKRYSISGETVAAIFRGNTWNHVTGFPPNPKSKRRFVYMSCLSRPETNGEAEAYDKEQDEKQLSELRRLENKAMDAKHSAEYKKAEIRQMRENEVVDKKAREQDRKYKNPPEEEGGEE